MPVPIRAASPADGAAIAEIYNEGIAERSSTFETEPRRADDVLAWLKAGERLPLLVAGEADVLGWVRIAPYSERRAYAGVGEVSAYVAEARRQALSRERGELRLVRRSGWREDGLHLRHGRLDGGWRDVLVVEKLLDSRDTAQPNKEGRCRSTYPNSATRQIPGPG